MTLIAHGVASDIIANVDQDSISAPGGNINVTAGRDIAFGLIGSNFDNDVRANGTITVTTGRDFLLDGFADMASDTFGQDTGGDVIVNAGRNITLLAGTDAGILASGSAGADIILTTGAGGTLTLNSGNGTAPFASLISQSGDVIANADRISIGANGAISTPAFAGKVALRPATDGWAIDLGSATDAAFALELSDAELDRVFTQTLYLGGPDAGEVTVSSNLSPLNAPSVTIQSGANIVVNAGVSVAVGASLRFRAGDDLLLIAGSSLAGGSITGFIDFGDTDPGTGGTAFVDAGFAAAVQFTGEADSDSLFGGLANDILNGAGGADTLSGRGGADVLNGGTGADQMTGGLGDDVYKVDSFGDMVIEAVGEGTDTVQASVSHALAADVEKLILTGSADTNGTGNDLDNQLNGNAGDDTYTVDNAGDTVVEASNNGNDLVRSSITFSLGGKQIENLTLIGSGNIDGTGNSFANTLTGNSGGNVLNGSSGVDIMIGLGGDDFYAVDNFGDTVIEAVSEGTDRVQSSVSHALAANVENLTLTGSANSSGTGNSLDNILTGNAGNNGLNGRAGADTMAGGNGDDTYAVDNVGDTVTEASNSGIDLVRSSITFSLGGKQVENLTLIGSDNIDGTGNSFANTLTGNSGNNDLNGSSGADTMVGGTGDDTYTVDNAGDVVVEASNGGTDLVRSSITFSLGGKQIENLTLIGSGNIDGTGNSFDNILTGNSGNNVLNGSSGADRMIGLGGNDTYVVDDAGDVVSEASNGGTDLVRSSITFSLGGKQVENLTLTGSASIDGTGNSFNNTLIGNSGNNVLNGAAGADALTGGTGADSFVFRNSLGASNIDTITDFNVAADTIQIDSAIFDTIVGTGTLSVAQFAANASGTAQDASDRIIYETDTGKLFFDSNGSAAGGSIQFALLDVGLALTNADFFMV